MTAEKNEKRDPVDADPRHAPGQSLAQQLNKFIDERAFTWSLVAVGSVFLACWEWIAWTFHRQPQPVLFSILALVMVVVAAYRIRAARREVRDLKLGMQGEKAVGLFLQDELLPKGYHVFHDIVDDRGNIDHAVIGPAGVFAIETKTISKPLRGDVRVQYDGEHVTVNGFAPDRDPIAQARACASRLHDILLKYSGKDVEVRSVVLYPGWYVRKQPWGVKTWVLNHTAFVKFLDRESQRFDAEEIRVLKEGLCRYISDRDQKRDG